MEFLVLSAMNQKLLFSNDVRHYFILGIVFLLVVVLMAHQIDLPGPMIDNVRPSGNLHKWMIGDPDFNIKNHITIFDIKIKLPSYYNGINVQYLLMAPFVSALGISVTTVRILGIVIVLLVMLFTYLFSREYLNKDVALIATSVLAFMPSTIYFGKFALWPDFTLAFFFMAMLYFMIKWKHTQKQYYLFLGFLFLGLGISEKIIYLWIVIALIVSFFVFRPKLYINIKNVFIAISSTILGSILLILAWAKYHSKFIEYLLVRTGDTPKGHSNSAILDNTFHRLFDFYQLLDGSYFNLFGASYGNPIFPTFFLVSAGFSILLIYFKNSFSKKASFLTLIFFIMAGLSIFSVTVIASPHLLIFLPIISIIIAIFIVEFSNLINLKISKNFLKPVIIISLTLLLVISNFFVILEYKQVLEVKGGVLNHSKEMYKVSEFLVKNNYTNVVALDNTFWGTIYAASEGKIDPKIVLLSRGGSDSQYENQLKDIVDDPNTVYLRYNDDRYPPKYAKSEKIQNVLEKLGKEKEIIAEFPDFTGKPIFRAFKIIDKIQP